MHDSKSGQDDAFARALKEAFGNRATPDTIKRARELYARHRTDDVLKRLNGVVTNKNGKGESLPGTGDQPR